MSIRELAQQLLNAAKPAEVPASVEAPTCPTLGGNDRIVADRHQRRIEYVLQPNGEVGPLMNEMNIAPWLDAPAVASLTASFVEVSNGSLEWFDGGSALTIENKADDGFDPVTVADRTIEARIRSVIESRFPDHAIVGEEAARRPGSVDVEWIIDPIDGTRAFVTGRPMWGSLIGVSVGDVPVAGWMHQPVLGVTHVAHDGVTTVRSGVNAPVEARTRSVTSLGDAVLLCTHPSMFVTDEEQAGFAAIERSVKLSRFDGDCANYGFLASGRADLVVENQLQPYDIVPLIPIIEGAGGVITAADGGSPLAGGWIVAAANATLHRAALDVIGEGRRRAT